MTFRPAWLRSAAYRTFYRLPRRVRTQLVRRLTPNYTVGAVVLLRDSRQRLLLVRQPRSSGWSLPGGLSNRGENPADTAARELYEEVGVRLKPGQLKPADPNARANARSQQIDMIFTATIDSDVELRTDPAEIVEARWHNVKALPELTPTTVSLLGLHGTKSSVT